MNYLAIYNREIKKVKSEIWKHFANRFIIEILYSRYEHIRGCFRVKIPLASISVKEVKKGVISFNFNVRGAYLEVRDKGKSAWRNIFYCLKDGFAKNQYLDIKEKFLKVTDEKSLNTVLNGIYIGNTLDSDLGEMLISVFKKTDMYKNICKDCDDANKNYEKITKNNNQETELFKIRILSTGRIKMIFMEYGKEKARTYDNFDKLISLGISASGSWSTITDCIKNECELFRKYL